MKKIIFLFAAIVALASCSITKRHYAPGYHVEWKKLRSHLEQPNGVSKERLASEELVNAAQNESQSDASTYQNPSFSKSYSSEESVLMNNEEMATEQPQQYDESLANIDSSNDWVQLNNRNSQDLVEAPVMATPPTGATNTMALIGFILSMSSFLLVITCVPGLIFSLIGLKQIREGNGEGKGLAIAGIVIGALYTLVILFYVGVIAASYAFGW